MIPRFDRRPDLIAPPAITPRVLNILEALQRHPGGLSTLYLKSLTAPKGDKANFCDTLQTLYHHGYIDRPMTLNHPTLWAAYLVYRLADKGKHTLAGHEKLSAYKNPPSNDPTHDYMASCLTASIEKAVHSAGFRYISADEIIKKAPITTQYPKKETGKRAASPFDIPARVDRDFSYDGRKYQWRFTKPITPDALFGIEYDTDTAYFALEADRDSEDGFSSDSSKNSLLSKMLRYQDVAKRGTALTHFNIPNFMILFVTMSESRVDLIEKLEMQFLNLPKRDGGGPGASYIASTHIPYFGNYYTPPMTHDLCNREWKRAGTIPFSLI